METYILVTWPHSQEYMNYEWFDDEAILDCNCKTENSSCFIPIKRYEEINNEYLLKIEKEKEEKKNLETKRTKRYEGILYTTINETTLIGKYKDTNKLVFNEKGKDIPRGIAQYLSIIEINIEDDNDKRVVASTNPIFNSDKSVLHINSKTIKKYVEEQGKVEFSIVKKYIEDLNEYQNIIIIKKL